MFQNDRDKVARLRGILYSVRQAIERDGTDKIHPDEDELRELLPEITEILDATADQPGEVPETFSSVWKPRTVVSIWGRCKLEVGQRWGYFRATPEGTIPILGPGSENVVLPLTVVAIGADGEVVLRPADVALAGTFFPEREIEFKGKATKTRDCPFMWVSDRLAKGSDTYKEGDLLAHEAWNVWGQMHLHQG